MTVMNKNHTDDKIMTRLNSENVCQNSGNHLLPSHIQSRKPKDSERDIQNYNYTCCFICM